MELLIFAVLVLTYLWWFPLFLKIVLFFVPSSFFEDSRQTPKAPAVHPFNYVPYKDSTPDPFANINTPTEWRANQFMSAEDKLRYLRSSKWTVLRTSVLIRDNSTCQSCGSKNNLHIHHITYEKLGDERMEDLVTLCSICHQEVHDRLGYDRTTVFNFSTKN